MAEPIRHETLTKLHTTLQHLIEESRLTEEELSLCRPFLNRLDQVIRKMSNRIATLENNMRDRPMEVLLAGRKLRVTTEEIDKYLDHVVNNIREVIFQANPSGDWIFLNRAWEELTGYSVEESLGMNYMEFLDNVHPDYHQYLQEVSHHGFEQMAQIFQVTNKHGENLWLDVKVNATRDANGVKDGFIGAMVDITKMKKIENELIKANQAKNEFLSTISHEIRTPLNAVVGLTNLLLLNEHLPEQNENLTSLKFSSEHLLNLINEVLDLEKIDSGKITLEYRNFSFYDLLDGLNRNYSRLASAKNLKFSIEQNTFIPATLIGDSTRLHQVLSNLINNAIRFTNKGEVVLKIEILNKDDQNVQIRFNVLDTGIGIPAEKLDRIFEPFAQADHTMGKKYGGSGLGLTISNKILALYNSELMVESQLDNGSRFFFELNFRMPSEFEYNSDNGEDNNNQKLSGMRVLLVEDNELNIRVISQFLNRWQVHVNVALDGQMAVDMSAKNDYDLVLMDLQLPVMDGYEACRRIRSLQNGSSVHLPIVALTATAHQEIRNQIQEAGMNDYLSKPFDPEDLYQILLRNFRKAVG